ncbi:uncharacterized protein BX663DRAFT_505306 [Cokeromyces recurvatus]|uniref:uncharacterized protein n=1 Tax=Cokeromyces recurvatus TaxID=90255 RepID=UPI0022201043|nr:uncharacterized protein BX663DRAFT_505306 [Cokeromyces recurvatus]KAI7903812.1 hypothetical protein BX663DRAFT_505306 [Cokeromyces recurvatus]
MTDLTTYKVTFNTTNKYLKYFCNKAASDWTFKKYKNYFSDKDHEKIRKVFVKNLQTVKDDSKNIPPIVNQHINRLMEPFNSTSNAPTASTDSALSIPSSSTINNITVKGNYYD